ncbi:MAG: type II toxin-antitoxin system VapC family toxin [Acetobacteraceae bacterium]
MSLVLDASMALAWCFESEQTPAVMAVLDRVTEHGGHAPALWPMEMANGLATAQRRKRLTATQRARLAGLVQALPVRVDPGSAMLTWGAVAVLAERYELSVYDAAYLELAIRLALPLASLDKPLRAAAVSAGVALVE